MIMKKKKLIATLRVLMTSDSNYPPNHTPHLMRVKMREWGRITRQLTSVVLLAPRGVIKLHSF
jgi:hypothetical protein